ncbi:MAG: hypothetical protein J7L96_06965, partial [Bacteroidales bacterium]|nr:hypothetical protein [Bacteroidales bacterium]
AKGNKILKEPTIIAPENSEIRPDRVVIIDGVATVIEYKTGNKSPRHSQQVNSYKEAIGRMGYASSKGYLVYLDLGTIEEIV